MNKVAVVGAGLALAACAGTKRSGQRAGSKARRSTERSPWGMPYGLRDSPVDVCIHICVRFHDYKANTGGLKWGVHFWREWWRLLNVVPSGKHFAKLKDLLESPDLATQRQGVELARMVWTPGDDQGRGGMAWVPPFDVLSAARAEQMEESGLLQPGHAAGLAVGAAQRLDIRNVSLTSASFAGSALGYTQAYESTLRETDFEDTLINQGRFRRIDLRGSNFNRTGCYDTIFHECDLRDTRWTDTSFDGVRFFRCDLRGAKMEGSQRRLMNTVYGECVGVPSGLVSHQVRGPKRIVWERQPPGAKKKWGKIGAKS